MMSSSSVAKIRRINSLFSTEPGTMAIFPDFAEPVAVSRDQDATRSCAPPHLGHDISSNASPTPAAHRAENPPRLRQPRSPQDTKEPQGLFFPSAQKQKN